MAFLKYFFVQWFSNLAEHWNHLGSSDKYRCMGSILIPRICAAWASVLFKFPQLILMCSQGRESPYQWARLGVKVRSRLSDHIPKPRQFGLQVQINRLTASHPTTSPKSQHHQDANLLSVHSLNIMAPTPGTTEHPGAAAYQSWRNE